MSKKSKTNDIELENELEQELNEEYQHEENLQKEKQAVKKRKSEIKHSVDGKSENKIPKALLMKEMIDIVVPVPGHPEVNTCKRFAKDVKVVRPVFIKAIMQTKIAKYEILE